MSIHVAILRPEYIRHLLAGRKTVEARLTRMRIAPLGRVHVGDRVFFKQTSGPFRATAVVERVLSRTDMTRADVAALRRRWNPLIRGSRAFWEAKADARHATLLWLVGVQPVDAGPDYSHLRRSRPRAAWFVLSGTDAAREAPTIIAPR